MADFSKLCIASDLSDKRQLPQTTLLRRSKSDRTADITHEFHVAASALHTGCLVKDEYFTLFEAVGALEIMDPKMDSGFLRPGESVEHDYDVLRELVPEEVIGIMDQMLCFEMTWHMGHPLSQSLLTSAYIDRLLWPDPKVLEQARFERDRIPGPGNELLHLVLRSYCLGLVKCCDLVRRTIISKHYYEEEDFVMSLYHRKLLDDFELADISTKIEDAMRYVAIEVESMGVIIRDALLNRLQLRRKLLSAVQHDGVLDQQRARLWEECLELIPMLSQTNNLGVASEDSFGIKIQRKLASSVPPRPIVKISFDDALTILKGICKDGRDSYRILDCRTGTGLMTFVMTYQARKPETSVYIRCLLQSLILGDMRVLGTISLKQYLFDDFEELVLPADILVDPANADIEAPQDPRFQISKRMDAFVTNAANFFLNISRNLCMNRSRVRRVMCRDAVEWESLQVEAERLDTELRAYSREEPIRESNASSEMIWSFPLSSWAYYYRLRQMEWIVQMGFELDIYQVDELAGMYWYLQHLASTRLQHIERIRTFSMHRLKCIAKPTLEQKSSFRRSFSFLDFAKLEASATQSFAEGLSCLFSFLAYLGLTPAPYHQLPYSRPALRYSLRMRPFLSVSLPEVPSFPDFVSRVSLDDPERNAGDLVHQAASSKNQTREKASSILELADQALAAARKDWEAISKTNAGIARCIGCEDWWRASVKNVVRACITANIMTTISKTAMSNAASKDVRNSLRVELLKSNELYHTWWIVPRISAT